MNRKGFTLIELLVVIAIIGIIAMIAIPAYIGQQKRAARSEAYTNLQNLRLLEEQFYAENSTYAGPFQPCQADQDNIAAISAPAALPGFKPGNALSYSYCILKDQKLQTPVANPPVAVALGAGDPPACFVAFAYGNTTSRVNGDVFAIDCNNNRNF